MTGVPTPISTGGNFVFPADVTFADDGDILAVDRDAFASELGGVIRVDSVTGTQSIVSNNAISDAAGGKQLFSDPISLERKGGSLYVTDFDRPRSVIKVDIDTGKESVVTKNGDLVAPFGIAIDGSKLLVSDAGAYGTNGGVIKVDPKTGKQTEVASHGDFKNPQMIALAGHNSAYVTDAGSFDFKGAIFKVDLKTGHQKVLVKTHDFHAPGGIAPVGGHEAVVSDCCVNANGALYTVNLKNGDETLLTGSGLHNPLGIRVAP